MTPTERLALLLNGLVVLADLGALVALSDQSLPFYVFVSLLVGFAAPVVSSVAIVRRAKGGPLPRAEEPSARTILEVDARLEALERGNTAGVRELTAWGEGAGLAAPHLEPTPTTVGPQRTPSR